MSSFKAGTGAAKPFAGKQATISRGGPGVNEKEGAGVEYGLSGYEANMDTQQNEPMVDTDKDPMTGNPTERIKPRGWDKVSSKGKPFWIEK